MSGCCHRVINLSDLHIEHETNIRGSELEQLFYCSGLADSTATQIKTPCLSE